MEANHRRVSASFYGFTLEEKTLLTVELAERLKGLPPYLFAEIDKVKDEMRRQGSCR